MVSGGRVCIFINFLYVHSNLVIIKYHSSLLEKQFELIILIFPHNAKADQNSQMQVDPGRLSAVVNSQILVLNYVFYVCYLIAIIIISATLPTYARNFIRRLQR